MSLLRVEGLVIRYPRNDGGWFRAAGYETAVDGISFDIARGETLALVGESGCGKSSTARAICGLTPYNGGRMLLDGQPFEADPRARHRRIQLVFQDPYSALDPRQSIGAAIAEPLLNHRLCDRRNAARQAGALLERVGLTARDAARYPHAFSGGQRQRIVIARALALEPDLLIADEAVSALDVLVQAQILALLADLQRERGLAQLFITHDLAVAYQVADRVAVMKDGHIVEQGPTEQLFRQPQAAYTRQLLSAVPVPDPPRERAKRRSPAG